MHHFVFNSSAPSNVSNVIVTDLMDGIMVEWSEPEFPNGMLQYEVTLQQVDLARSLSTFPDLVNVTSDTEIIFSVDIRPYYLYTAIVIPFTAAPVRGNPADNTLQTPEGCKWIL